MGLFCIQFFVQSFSKRFFGAANFLKSERTKNFLARFGNGNFASEDVEKMKWFMAFSSNRFYRNLSFVRG